MKASVHCNCLRTYIFNGTKHSAKERRVTVFPPGLKRRGGDEHFGAVYAWAHTLLAYTTILCCVNTVIRGVLCLLVWGKDRVKGCARCILYVGELHLELVQVTLAHLCGVCANCCPISRWCEDTTCQELQ